MKQAPIETDGPPDSELFSPEELAIMNEAEGVVDDVTTGSPDIAELQRQYKALARMVAEGGERERQLRAVVNELSLLANGGDQHRAYQEQTEKLAKLLMASSERELHLQQCLEAVRNVALSRVRNVM